MSEESLQQEFIELDKVIKKAQIQARPFNKIIRESRKRQKEIKRELRTAKRSRAPIKLKPIAGTQCLGADIRILKFVPRKPSETITQEIRCPRKAYETGYCGYHNRELERYGKVRHFQGL